MSQENLEKALKLLTELETQVGEAGKAQLAEAKAALQAAQKDGEGQDAAALREEMQQQKIKDSEFVTIMVHEIRKPMTSIRGYMDMLVRNLIPDEAMKTQIMGTIRNNVLSMEQLVTDISDVSKFKSGRIKPSPKMEMFKNIVMQLEKDLKPLAEARKVELTFDVPQGLPLLNLDSGRVEQALRKIIENAVKYTPEGNGKIQVSAEGLGDKLKVVVKDNGVGISEADQKQMAEIFYRGDQELVTQTKGYGLGLPIAIACIELVKGELRWESKVDSGTTVEMLLPAMAS